MKVKHLFSSIIFLLLVFFLVGCNNDNNKKLVVATNAEFAPFEYVENGEIKGFDMDLIRAYGKYANVTIEIKDMDFDGALTAVSEGKADMALAGITVSDSRKKTMSFSNSYYSALLVVIVRENSTYASINDNDLLLEELSKNKASIGCQMGTTGQYYIEGSEDWEFDGIKDTTCVSYSNGALAVQALSDGKLDAVIIDSAPASLYTKAIGGVKVVENVILTSDEYAIATGLNNTELLESLNLFIEEAKNNGLMDEIINTYFGEGDFEISNTVWNKANILSVLKGLANTFIITILAFILGILFGTLVSLVNGINSNKFYIKGLKYLSKTYVAIFRGTPIMVQLLIIYYVIFRYFTGDALWIAVLGFGLNSGAYVSEIIRGGINAVPQGQMEAGRSLGLSYPVVMKKIILPQAIKNCLPSLGNEFISLIKETSVVGFIGAFDLTLAFRKIANITYDYAQTYLIMGLMYFTIIVVITLLLNKFERRLSHARTK